ncbi:MAG TPA: hypothetical protein VHN58_10785 [Croceicoccus sp.]|nr:hypothetical protein [Croceicoccus sp.]
MPRFANEPTVKLIVRSTATSRRTALSTGTTPATLPRWFRLQCGIRPFDIAGQQDHAFTHADLDAQQSVDRGIYCADAVCDPRIGIAVTHRVDRP